MEKLVYYRYLGNGIVRMAINLALVFIVSKYNFGIYHIHPYLYFELITSLLVFAILYEYLNLKQCIIIVNGSLMICGMKNEKGGLYGFMLGLQCIFPLILLFARIISTIGLYRIIFYLIIIAYLWAMILLIIKSKKECKVVIIKPGTNINVISQNSLDEQIFSIDNEKYGIDLFFRINKFINECGILKSNGA